MRELLALVFLVAGTTALAQERTVEPTWLYRDLSAAREAAIDVSSPTCHYAALFGEGDSEKRYPQSISRFGQLTVDPGGTCQAVSYPRVEELLFVREGSGVLTYGNEPHPLRANDFTYIAPTIRHAISNDSSQPLRIILATVRVPAERKLGPPSKLAVGNLDEIQEQTVGGHPKSVLYKLLIGPHDAHRDRINAAYNVADFFLMDFAPAGTNFPHHHEIAEEIYLILDGQGKMAAGGGMDGVEGLHPAKPGDAYYFRQNCTVGFYNQDGANAKAHILAIRAYVPIPRNLD